MSDRTDGVPLVLAIDDDPVWRTVYEGMIAGTGLADYASATDARSGLKMCVDLRPDVVLIDLRGELDASLDLAESIEASRSGDPTVIITTASTDRGVHRRIADRGMRAAVKPLSSSTICELLLTAPCSGVAYVA